MPDIYKTLSQLNIIFQMMLIDILDLATGSPLDYQTASYFVRVSWPTEGAPAFKVTEDIAFIRVTEDDDPINRQRETEETRINDFLLNERTSYTRVISLYIVFYGPNSWERAQTVRDGIFRDIYRLSLAKDKIYPIIDIVAPKRVPEPFQSQYWERVDLELRFNELIAKNTDIGVIDIADIIVENEDGIKADIIVESE